jgi:hypothetical protein
LITLLTLSLFLTTTLNTRINDNLISVGFRFGFWLSSVTLPDNPYRLVGACSHSGLYKYQPSTSVVAPIVSNCSYNHLRETFTRELDWPEFCGSLIAPWKSSYPIPLNAQANYGLGVLVTSSNEGQQSGLPFQPVAVVPHCFQIRFRDWSLGPHSKFDLTEPYNATWTRCVSSRYSCIRLNRIDSHFHHTHSRRDLIRDRYRRWHLSD